MKTDHQDPLALGNGVKRRLHVGDVDPAGPDHPLQNSIFRDDSAQILPR
jgi:hypothetical protein